MFQLVFARRSEETHFGVGKEVVVDEICDAQLADTRVCKGNADGFELRFCTTGSCGGGRNFDGHDYWGG